MAAAMVQHKTSYTKLTSYERRRDEARRDKQLVTIHIVCTILCNCLAFSRLVSSRLLSSRVSGCSTRYVC